MPTVKTEPLLLYSPIKSETYSLDISGTPFKFSRHMWEGVSLEWLKQEGAGITDLSTDIWTDLEPSLVYLYIGGNSLENIGFHPFKGLAKLQTLGLDEAGLTSSDLNSKLWTGLGSLKKLDLSRNHFETLMAHSFQGLNGLYSLRLNSCRIKHMNARALEGFVSLGYLYIQGNPIVAMDVNVFGSTLFEQKLYITFDYNSMPCFRDLCLVNEKVKATNLEWERLRCENFNTSVKHYLVNEC